MTAVPLPTRLSPSKVSSFSSCALAFKFETILGIPDAPGPATLVGTCGHRALELLFANNPPGWRSREVANECVARAWLEIQQDPQFIALKLNVGERHEFLAAVIAAVSNYYRLEDPREIEPIGIEIKLVTTVAGFDISGIIDRLDPGLIVIDYKTGKTPSEKYEADKLVGLKAYALLCEDNFGSLPISTKLYYLKGPKPLTIEWVPTPQKMRAFRARLTAVWDAIERACERDNFQPRTGPLCNYCAYKPYCPAWGGDPALAPKGAT